MISLRNAVLSIAAVFAFGFGAIATPFAQAQEQFPSKPIHIIVPYPAGGIGDQLARAIAKQMEEYLKQIVLVENVTGAGGVIGTSRVARAPNDGYTLLLGNTGPISVSPQVTKTPYDPVKDLAPISLIAQAPLLLAVQANNSAKTLKEFIGQARASGTSWNFGSTGIASLSHLTGEYFNSAAGTRLTHVPYQGGAQMVSAFASGDLQMAFVTGPDSAAMLNSGKIQYLAVAAPQKTDVAPGVPAIADDIPGFASNVWYGILAPAETPAAVLRRLHDAIAFAVARPETQKAFAGKYLEVRSSTPKELADQIRTDMANWGRVIKETNISLK